MLQICINEDSGQFIIIIGQVINAPQIIERNTLECYYGAERKRRSMSDVVERFQVKSLDSCNDGHPSNGKMERAVLMELNKKSEKPWNSNRKGCEVHWTYGVGKKLFGRWSVLFQCRSTQAWQSIALQILRGGKKQSWPKLLR